MYMMRDLGVTEPLPDRQRPAEHNSCHLFSDTLLLTPVHDIAVPEKLACQHSG